MKVRWTRRSTVALTAIRSHIANDDPVAAQALWLRVRSYVNTKLIDHPMMGRPGRVEGTRESVVHRNYLIVYRVTEDAIEIVTVRHAAQEWPEQF